MIILLATSAGASAVCPLEAGPSHEVVRVIDGETVLLDDGREVRLIGALAPQPNLTADTEIWPPAEDARRALDALVGGRSVELRYQGRKRDRYGRELAQVFVATEGGAANDLDGAWVQEALIRAGHARAYTLPGNEGCIRELMAAEDEARRAVRGLWRRPTYRVREAGDVAGLSRLTGKFVVVEGRVAQVAQRAKQIYINFGADWRRDFTASLVASRADRTVDGAARLQSLAGRRVRVRGWIEQRNGPMISLNSFDEIEWLDAPPAGPSAATAAAPAANPPAEHETAPR